MFLRSSHMKKIVLLPALLACAFCFGEVFTKKIEVDEIYRIEMTYDSGTGILDMNMLAKNTTVFDEPYAEEQMQAALDDFICDYEVCGCEIRSRDLNYRYDGGKYTSLDKKIHVSK